MCGVVCVCVGVFVCFEGQHLDDMTFDAVIWHGSLSRPYLCHIHCSRSLKENCSFSVKVSVKCEKQLWFCR